MLVQGLLTALLIFVAFIIGYKLISKVLEKDDSE